MSRPGSLPEKLKDFPENWFVDCQREKCQLWVEDKIIMAKGCPPETIREGHCGLIK